MNKTYIMLKDTPVLEIEDYCCRILDYEHLPISLRYREVNFDDVMHGWTENRTMNIGKTNAKKLLAGFRISQSNPYLIARLFHFASLTDCYWLKESGENLTWKQMNLFRNPLEKAVSATALMGVNGSFRELVQKVHTPELTVQGMAAKAWIRESDGLYLYKVGKKEIAASKILDALNIPHVSYLEAEEADLRQIADQEHIDRIYFSGEKIVKCKIISTEEKAIVSWEDFQIYCSYHDINEYDYIRQSDPAAYYQMQAVDYILGNEDRHGANFGFFMDNQTGSLLGFYPLMDHDHAFSTDKNIPSQTSELEESLQEAAFNAIRSVNIELSNVLEMEKPEEITDAEWAATVERTKDLYIRQQLIHENR
ncbi:hypothetical protein [Clostridium sp. Marseille-P2415]|uniref:hypothetical protein n=1 Tax=Clostridium sp. Marseille-P2415 TaxID=1805471 RepID=UPI000988663B|nr:hypothetical protein [Clostridium sp. Marseille-P2415]